MEGIHGFFFFWGSELVLIALLVAAYFLVRSVRQFQTTCFQAVVSAACAILNPYVVHRLLWILGVKTYYFRPLFSPSLYVALLAAVVAGHIALRRIKRSSAPLHGRVLAWVGISIGYAVVVGGLGFVLLEIVAWNLGAWKG